MSETTILDPKQAAIVTEDGGWRLLLPEMADDVALPGEMVLLAACFMRQGDEDWKQDMAEWFEEQRQAMGSEDGG